MEEKEGPRGLFLQNAKPGCDVPSATISTQGLWKESAEPLREVQVGALIWEVNIYFFADIIFCSSKHIKPSPAFEFVTFQVLFYFSWSNICEQVFASVCLRIWLSTGLVWKTSHYWPKDHEGK